MPNGSGMPKAANREEIRRIRLEKLRSNLTYPVVSGILIFLSWIAGLLIGYFSNSTFWNETVLGRTYPYYVPVFAITAAGADSGMGKKVLFVVVTSILSLIAFVFGMVYASSATATLYGVYSKGKWNAYPPDNK